MVGTDEAFFEDDRNDQTVLNIYNEKSGILDGDADNEVDLASQAYQIWKNAIDRDPTLQKTISELPDVVYSTRKHTSNLEGPPGVLVYVRTGEDNDALAWVDKDGNCVTQSQLAVLRAAECRPDTPALGRTLRHAHQPIRHPVDTQLQLAAVNVLTGVGKCAR